MTEMAAPLRFLIAGGSIVGLGLALCFESAGIEYELFEKGEVVPQLGASIGWHPHSLRILEQLGVRDEIERGAVPLLHQQHFDERGRCFEDSNVLVEIKKRYVTKIG
ncbi:Monooxygenase FAD-binding protein, partial [Lasiodiplodia theobromae]|uniref:Monooxygenase FAD-binding protein n=1 Tax=Lasiodiplodia theobromae TaxID=45133 RepID=UPI0015C30DF7